MNLNAAAEINSLKNPFLVRLAEENGRLYIDVCGSRAEPVEPRNLGYFGGDAEIARRLLNAEEAVPDFSRVYRVCFDSYIGYSVRCERYTARDGSERFELGSCFRIFSKSKYLDYIAKSTFALRVGREIKHYGIYCELQIIDVASEDEPLISVITAP